MTEPILSVKNLNTSFYTEEGVVEAVDGVSFDLYDGEMLGIVGESGSGKSVTAQSILRLIDNPGKIDEGEIYYKGENILEMDNNELKDVRGGQISYIFQDPMSSLNPVFTVGQQICRVIRQHTELTKEEARDRAIELLEDVGISQPASRIDEYPNQFSGGMRQRVLLAMAISCEPNIIIADEPTTALDVTIEAQIFDLLEDLQEKHGVSIILITHDLGVVAESCDRVAIMYAGRFVEQSTVKALFKDPKHPYTRGLLRSIPSLYDNKNKLTPIEGNVPDLTNKPSGCSFHPRCPHATDECSSYDPELREVQDDHHSACINVAGYGNIPIGRPSVVDQEVDQ